VSTLNQIVDVLEQLFGFIDGSRLSEKALLNINDQQSDVALIRLLSLFVACSYHHK
jgi:hypothetical protein